MKTVGILIPVANEEKTIKEFTNCLLSQCDLLEQHDVTVHYIMDSYSKDSTQSILENEFGDNVQVLFHEKSTGLVSAYLHGYKHCIESGFDYIVEMDSGFSHKPEHLPDFLKHLDEGYDAVFGSRFMKGSVYETTLFRKFVSKMGTVLCNTMLGTDYRDATSGYQAFKRDTLIDFDFDKFISTGGMFQTEIKFYVYDRRTDEIEEEISKLPLYFKNAARTFFSSKVWQNRPYYKFRLKEIPIEFIMSDTSFKSSWVWDSIKILNRLYENKQLVFKKGVINGND